MGQWPNISMQRTPLCAAADAERWAAGRVLWFASRWTQTYFLPMT